MPDQTRNQVAIAGAGPVGPPLASHDLQRLSA